MVGTARVLFFVYLRLWHDGGVRLYRHPQLNRQSRPETRTWSASDGFLPFIPVIHCQGEGHFHILFRSPLCRCGAPPKQDKSLPSSGRNPVAHMATLHLGYGFIHMATLTGPDLNVDVATYSPGVWTRGSLHPCFVGSIKERRKSVLPSRRIKGDRKYLLCSSWRVTMPFTQSAERYNNGPCMPILCPLLSRIL